MMKLQITLFLVYLYPLILYIPEALVGRYDLKPLSCAPAEMAQE